MKDNSEKKFNLIYIYFLSIIYLEILYKIFTFGIANLFSLELVYATLFATSFSLIFTFLSRIFHNKTNKNITLTILIILCSWYSIQFIFKKIFNTFFSINLFEIADQAVQFSSTAIMEIIKNIPLLLFLFLPYFLVLIYSSKINFHHPINKKIYVCDFIITIIAILLFGLSLQIGKVDSNSAYVSWNEVDNNTINMEHLGVGISTYLDLKRFLFGFSESISITDNDIVTEETDTDITNDIYDYNNLGSNESNVTIKDMDNYFASETGTLKNEYTSKFKGKNLIVIMGESLNTIGISEEYTPTLYKLSHEGFQFNNFYTPVNLSTIGGEFQNLTGLFANLSTLNNNWRSGSNYFPYGLGTVFNHLNYNTYAYHANYGTFQDRNIYLKNIGFNNFSYHGNGLESKMNCDVWPQSDADMVDVTYSDWINSSEPFLTYYISVLGHMPWSWSANAMSKKNKTALSGSGYSEEAAAYIAATIELDKAVQELIDKLTDTGKLEDTVIAIIPDHYPYSMDLSTINELSDFERDSVVGVNKRTLILWNSDMDTVSVDKVSSQVDFIPTLYNLFGINYDSRLYMGKDILSTEEGLVYFTNRSWVTNKGTYYASTNKFESNSDDVSDDYVASINKKVQNRINMSKLIMQYDYYRKIFNE